MEALKKSIAAGNLSPVYFFHGPESYLKEEFTALIRTAAFPDEQEAAANTHILYGAETTPGELVARASEYPMFTPRQLIVVRQADKMKKPAGKEQQKQHEAKFASYMKNPAEFTILVFDADQLDRKDVDKAPYSHLKPFRHDFPLIKTPDLFAANRAREAGFEFDPEALKAFAAYIEPSSREICQEVEKLTTYASSREGERRITAADVYECVGISKTYNVFELEKAVASKNLRLSSGISLMIMEREGQKEGLMNIVRYLTTFFMRLWKVSQPEVRAMPQGEIAKALGMYGKQEYFVRNYISYAGAFSPLQTEQAVAALKEADGALKGLVPAPDEKYILLRLMQRILG